jgi:hypothetical protein
MAVDPVSGSAQSTNAARFAEYKKSSIQNARNLAQILYLEDKDTYEKSDRTADIPNAFYTRESTALSRAGWQAEAKYAGLQSIVENLLNMQTVKHGESQGLNYDEIMKQYSGSLKNFYQNLDVDNATRIKAQQDISEDGYWGVGQTSKRIIDFAIAISGGDTGKLGTLKSAIEKGFSQAEGAWGGSLPDISYQTRDAVMKGLDEWAGSAA